MDLALSCRIHSFTFYIAQGTKTNNKILHSRSIRQKPKARSKSEALRGARGGGLGAGCPYVLCAMCYVVSLSLFFIPRWEPRSLRSRSRKIPRGCWGISWSSLVGQGFSSLFSRRDPSGRRGGGVRWLLSFLLYFSCYASAHLSSFALLLFLEPEAEPSSMIRSFVSKAATSQSSSPAR